MTDLINKAQAALDFLRQHTQCGHVKLHVDHYAVIYIVVNYDRGWYDVTVYRDGGVNGAMGERIRNDLL